MKRTINILRSGTLIKEMILIKALVGTLFVSIGIARGGQAASREPHGTLEAL